MAVEASVRERREAIVREHMESENRHELDVTMGTFHHPRYELIVLNHPVTIGRALLGQLTRR